MTKEMTADWREVYLQERRRPGYVIDNGRSVVKRNEGALPRGRCASGSHNRRSPEDPPVKSKQEVPKGIPITPGEFTAHADRVNIKNQVGKSRSCDLPTPFAIIFSN